jgi:hypothetical protein
MRSLKTLPCWTQVWADCGVGCVRAQELLIEDGIYLKNEVSNMDSSWSLAPLPSDCKSDLEWDSSKDGGETLRMTLCVEWST